jgi:glycosyltransferase involved in cell wall biosynthesis
VKIGIGVTTRNRHGVFCHSMLRHDACKPPGARYAVVDDGSDLPVQALDSWQLIRHPAQQGIAAAKNSCLRALRDCDYIFLFDDDAYPAGPEWWKPYINAHQQAGINHLIYLEPIGRVQKVSDIETSGIVLERYSNCGGVLMFITQEVIKKVGGYDPRYGIYGYEHAGYTHRIHRAGLQKDIPPYLSVKAPIYAMDWRGKPQGATFAFSSSVKDEDIDELIAANKKIYEREEQANVYIPL